MKTIYYIYIYIFHLWRSHWSAFHGPVSGAFPGPSPVRSVSMVMWAAGLMLYDLGFGTRDSHHCLTSPRFATFFSNMSVLCGEQGSDFFRRGGSWWFLRISFFFFRRRCSPTSIIFVTLGIHFQVWSVRTVKLVPERGIKCTISIRWPKEVPWIFWAEPSRLHELLTILTDSIGLRAMDQLIPR